MSKTRMDKLRAGLASLPATVPAADAALAAVKNYAKPKPETVPVNLRMPAELRDRFVQLAAQRTAATGKPASAQQLMLEALAAWRPT